MNNREATILDALGVAAFDPEIDGISTAADVMSEAEEQRLIAQIDSAPLAPFKFQGWIGKRCTASFGWCYDFENGGFEPANQMPDWLLACRSRAAALSGIAEDDLVQSLLIRYDPGAGIGWHRDRSVFEHVVGISLGSRSTLRLRRRSGDRFERAALPLAPRSIYRLSGEARHLWEHSIVPMDQTRWSITFRTLAVPARARTLS